MTWCSDGSCLSCARLSRCATVNVAMVEEGGRCLLQEEADPGEVRARVRVVEQLGVFAVLPNPNPRININEESDIMATAKRPTLRSLVFAAGIKDKNKQVENVETYGLSVDDLYALLEPKFRGIRDLDEDGVLQLLAQANGKASATGSTTTPPADSGSRQEAGGGRGRGRGRRSETEPEPAKKPEPEPEPAKQPEPEGRRGRGRGRGREEAPAAPPTETKPETKGEGPSELALLTAAVADLTEQVKALTSLCTVSAEQIEKMQGVLEDLADVAEETNAGVESLYLEDFCDDDQSLADNLKRTRS